MEPKARTTVKKRPSYPQAPPEDFDPRACDDLQLINFGYPPRFQGRAPPEYQAKWERIVSGKIHHGTPGSLINGPEDKGPDPTRTWSGAQLTSPPENTKFKYICASWLVPKAYPHPDLYVNGVPEDATYKAGAWIGFNYKTGKDLEIVQAGTATEIKVKDGQISDSRMYAWTEWYPNPPKEISSDTLKVQPGDTITCLLSAPQQGEAHVWLTNEGSGTTVYYLIYKSDDDDSDDDDDDSDDFQAEKAEWIVEYNRGKKNSHLFPDYVSMFFYDTWAFTESVDDNNNQELRKCDTSGARLMKIVNTSTPIQLTPDVLMLYAYQHGPRLPDGLRLGD